jgi:Tfp pilus assembly protein PilN
MEVFTLTSDKDLPARVAAELRTRDVSAPRTLRVGLERSLAVVKTLELPRTAERDLRKLLAFELERRVPFPSEGMMFDGIPCSERTGQLTSFLVAACSAHVGERAAGLAMGVGRRPSSVSVACHDLPSLLPSRLPVARAVWAHRVGTHTELVFLDRGVARLSRTVSVEDPDLLHTEITRGLPLLQWDSYHALWISGDEAGRFIADWSSRTIGPRPAAPPYSSRAAERVSRLTQEHAGLGLLALAVAARRRSPLDLLPPDRRPWKPRRRHLVTAGMAAVTVVLGLALLVVQGITQERHLARLADESRRLEPEVKIVERLTTETARHKQILAALVALEGSGIRPLSVLLELTELIPTDAWLQALTMDRHGVELAGEATAASTLIPILEGSPRLERVEFTSPVTRGQEKERFRVRAHWEASR